MPVTTMSHCFTSGTVCPLLFLTSTFVLLVNLPSLNSHHIRVNKRCIYIYKKKKKEFKMKVEDAEISRILLWAAETLHYIMQLVSLI